jgi:LEA14-like dessication related protein
MLPMPRLIRSVALLLVLLVAGCASLSSRDPLTIDVAGIDPLPSEGLELRLAVRVRIQNPNDATIDYTGAALDLELNGQRLASGVSGELGTVARYGESVLTIPVTISAFNVARQLMGFIDNRNPERVTIRISGKLDGGFLSTYRFSDEESIELGRGGAL